jgi:F-type H+-transporting ATPase subunit delta
MESNTKAAHPYAIAAFEQALQEGDTGRWSEMLGLLSMVASDPLLVHLTANPKAKKQDVAELIIDVCGDRLTPTGRNFVRVLAENRRLGAVKDIAAAYEAERARAERRSDVTVVSAYELSPAEQNAINVAMTKRLGTKVDLSLETDPRLIGGVVIRIGDTVIDASIRGQLNELAQTLA